jgi:DUF4097 and DUF4098 domain-containing protein YvlB
MHATKSALGFAIASALALALLAPVAHAGKDVDKVMGSITAHAGEDYGDLATVNGSIRVEADAKARDIATVNGSVRLATGASVGDAATVNGSIKAESRASAGSLETVNGSIRLDEANRAAKIETVNGSIFVGRGSTVSKDIQTVNGAIGIVDTDVNGSISTVNGDITVGIGSHVRGGITIEKPTSNWMPVATKQRKPRIVIGPNAVVEGPLVFKREVNLYVHKTARIGQVTGATAVRYDGATAPKD